MYINEIMLDPNIISCMCIFVCGNAPLFTIETFNVLTTDMVGVKFTLKRKIG